MALLDDDKPLDVIAKGDYRRVSRVLAGPEATDARVSEPPVVPNGMRT